MNDDPLGGAPVLQVVEPGVDGVFRHVEGLVHYLIGRGVGVHLAYSSRRGSPALDDLVARVRGHGGETLDLRVGNAPSPADVPAWWRLRALAVRVGARIVHGHSSKAGVLARSLRAVLPRARVFYTPNAYFGMGIRPAWKNAPYNAVETVLGRVGTTVNISVDEAAFARRTLRIPDAHRRIIHNPVYLGRFAPADEVTRRAARAALGLPSDGLVVGSAGRLTFQKDPLTLYRAIAPLMRQRDDLWFCHLGRGELAPEVDALIAELGIAHRVVKVPVMDEPAAFYHSLDAFMMTSRYEAGWPIVILEALACGLPVVSSRCPGATDIDRGGLTHCWGAEIGDVAGFTAALQSWLDDKPNARASNHREVAIERFSPERCYGAVLEEYRRALGV